MARKGKRGGDRVPKAPAPVSGPGAMSRRTDSQVDRPQMERQQYESKSYGQGKALAEQQSGAPLAGQGRPSPGPSAGGGSAPPVVPAPVDVFGPSQRPAAPRGMPQQEMGPDILPEDPDMLLRAIYRQYPHPDIARLLGD